MKRIFLVLFALGSIFVAVLFLSFFSSNKATVTLPDGFVVQAELMRTPKEHARGLSGRKILEEGQGMLFVFPEPAPHSFWMKDMRFSIDIVWLLKEKVVFVVERASLPTSEGIPTFRPEVLADHVLELPAGSVEAHGIQVGTNLELGPS